MQSIHHLPTPALVVDLDRLERNIARMAARASALGVALRPHIKTHKCLEIGRLQVRASGAGITVSTPYEAEVFADAGFDDITWAFPLVGGRAVQMAALAKRTELRVVVDSERGVDDLAKGDVSFHVMIKVDCGYHRAGIPPDPAAVVRLVERLREGGHRFAGLLSHSGDAYDAAGTEARAAVAEAERATIVGVAEALRAGGIPVPVVSVGSTPGMTAVTDLSGVTEVRPGNYAYFDRTQVSLGSCRTADVAASVLTTVVSAGAAHSVCDAGALALSKDAGPGDGSYGDVWERYDENVIDPECRLTSLSQEHGRLSVRRPVGTRLRVLPNHSCLTAACFDHLYAVRGERVEARWRVWNGRN